jgi:hypothetical protein
MNDCVLIMNDCVPLQVRSFIDGAYQRTLGVLREKKELVDRMAQVCAEVIIWTWHVVN